LLSASKKVDVFRLVYVASGVLSVLVFGGHALWFVLAGEFVITALMRNLKPSWARYVFGDLKVKSKYGDFFRRYLEAFRRVAAERAMD
jgi:hypothetical protein